MDGSPPQQESSVRYRSWTDDPTGRREAPAFHLGLVLLTFLTMTVMAALSFSDSTSILERFFAGLQFSIPAMIILGSHEMGHYWMCRRYRVSATLPYFLPLPFGFGTLGAVIRIKEPLRKKAWLVDIGAAGPLTGFLLCLPFLFYGVSRAIPVTESVGPDEGFGYPLLVRFAQSLAGLHYTSATVHESPVFMAAWFGLLVTALNLLPIGQLDGGHVLRAVFGRRQPAVSRGVLAVALSAWLWGGYSWSFFALVVTLFIGVQHPPPDDDDSRLDGGRIAVAIACLVVFVLSAPAVPVAVPFWHLF